MHWAFSCTYIIIPIYTGGIAKNYILTYMLDVFPSLKKSK